MFTNVVDLANLKAGHERKGATGYLFASFVTHGQLAARDTWGLYGT